MSATQAAWRQSAAGVWRQVEARVLRQTEVGADHRWLDLELPHDFQAPEPGQFVQLLLGAHCSAALLPRPMSVAAVKRSREGVVLGFLYAPIGTGTLALASLKPGMRVEVLGPLGRGFPLAHPGTPVLVAGGRGVAPLLFAATELSRAGRRCEFVFGARDKEHLVELDTARRVLARLGGRLHLCTDDGSLGARGHAAALLERIAPRLPDPLVVHACGPHGMLGTIARWALAREIPAFLAMESVMACGTGVCRGCPLPRSEDARTRYRAETTPSLFGNKEWAMCCTDGPVFEARSLDWEHIA